MRFLSDIPMLLASLTISYPIFAQQTLRNGANSRIRNKFSRQYYRKVMLRSFHALMTVLKSRSKDNNAWPVSLAAFYELSTIPHAELDLLQSLAMSVHPTTVLNFLKKNGQAFSLLSKQVQFALACLFQLPFYMLFGNVVLNLVAIQAHIPFHIWTEAILEVSRAGVDAISVHELARRVTKRVNESCPVEFASSLKFLQALIQASKTPVITIPITKLFLDMLFDDGHLQINNTTSELGSQHAELSSTSLSFRALMAEYQHSTLRHHFFVHCPHRLMYALCRVKSSDWLRKLKRHWLEVDEDDVDHEDLGGDDAER
jgi:hypothetical protein